ncbi:hypothetical protein B9Z99_003945 [Klebsiella aerogenes]|nr:hypothetical protein B9Z99_003945 [Klebsiella aerogenes]
MEHLCCSEVSISPLFRWPNSVNHYKHITSVQVAKFSKPLHSCPARRNAGKCINAKKTITNIALARMITSLRPY